jgi:aspartate aminotransferase
MNVMTNRHIAPRVARIRPSPTAEISERLRELKAAGRMVINLGEGELDFDTPAHVKKAGIDAILTGDTKYTAVSGTAALKQAIIDKFHDENGLIFTPDQIIAGTGAKQLIFNALLATVRDGDEVVVPAPYWVSYPDMVRLADGSPQIVPCEENAGWKLRPETLAAAITPRTRWLLLNSPNNPTGALYGADDLRALAEVLAEHEHVLVMSDDIYEHILHEGEFTTLAQVAPALRHRILTVNGVSKAYSMTGWSLGYAAGPAWLIAEMEKLQSQSTSNASSISQAAAVAALREKSGFLRGWLDELKGRRDEAVEILSAAPDLHCRASAAAFYLFVNCAGALGKRTPDGREIVTDTDLAKFLVDRAGVGTVAGQAFGSSPYLRIAYAVPRAELKEACTRIVEACGLLRTPS